MIIRWIKETFDVLQRGYNNFVYSSTPADTVGPTIVYGFAGR